MKPLLLLLLLKVASFIGATASTVGFLSFFFWDALRPYRWHMVLGGTAVILVAEVLAHLLVKRSTATDGKGIETAERGDLDEAP